MVLGIIVHVEGCIHVVQVMMVVQFMEGDVGELRMSTESLPQVVTWNNQDTAEGRKHSALSSITCKTVMYQSYQSVMYLSPKTCYWLNKIFS
ncbi:hypothetical protein SKAU_G00239730 [Synaphobranchus kaupii]|uniref:Uncharacterized protein n=1 Tax=Synaphobranchus kaupii TaxID=118154 RepID=A0A9Q1ITS0_SYNKA|nr:hypothetical protein SKAU_G00239730 [Synaphobranchus kaupii]